MHDRSPWGPAVIALVFLLMGAIALVRADGPAVLIVVVLCALVAGWQARTATLRHLEAQRRREPEGRD